MSVEIYKTISLDSDYPLIHKLTITRSTINTMMKTDGKSSYNCIMQFIKLIDPHNLTSFVTVDYDYGVINFMHPNSKYRDDFEIYLSNNENLSAIRSIEETIQTINIIDLLKNGFVINVLKKEG